MTKQEITNIQILRAFAAVLVVLFHTTETANRYGFNVNILKPLEGWGSCGVDLFFVISGFIMVYVQHTKEATAIEFFSNRLIRIAPLYWILTTFLIFLFKGMPSAFNIQQISIGWIITSLTFTSQIISNSGPILYDGWTLEYEMMFYIIFSLSLTARTINRSIFVSSLIVALWAVLAKQYIVFEFAYGMLLGFLFISGNKIFQKHRLAFFLGLSTLLLTAVIRTNEINRAIIWGIPSALIVYGCIFMEQSRNHFLTKIGDASYSIYLIQVFTISAFYKLAKKLELSGNFNDAYAAICMLSTILMGYAVYVTIESKAAKQLIPLKKKFGK